jgi:anti-anti-sigma factor
VAAVTRLTFSTAVDGRRVRVALAGELDYRSAADLKDEFDRIVERLAPALVELDLSGLTFVDATGLGLFVGLTRQLRRHDGELRLLDVDNLNGHGGHACKCKGGELQIVNTPGDIGIFSAPAVWHHGGDDWLFVTTYESTKGYRLSGSPPRLHRKWANKRPGSSPVVAGGLLYVYDPGGGLRVYEPHSGRQVAKLDCGGGHWNSPIVVDGRIALPEGSANQHRTSGVLNIWRLP